MKIFVIRDLSEVEHDERVTVEGLRFIVSLPLPIMEKKIPVDRYGYVWNDSNYQVVFFNQPYLKKKST